ncbi:FUSC family protein [Escherichia coli]|nr:FUSC family protein [Escherichia coli]
MLGATAALLLAGHTLNEPWFFLLSMSGVACALYLGSVRTSRITSRMHFNWRATPAAIIAFPMVNITEASYELWDIAQARVCEVIVGIFSGGMMMMIPFSSSDATATC